MSSILPKNELENVKFCPRQKFFVRFLGVLKKNQKALSKFLTFKLQKVSTYLHKIQKVHVLAVRYFLIHISNFMNPSLFFLPQVGPKITLQVLVASEPK